MAEPVRVVLVSHEDAAVLLLFLLFIAFLLSRKGP